MPNFVKSKGSKEEAASGRDPRELRGDPRLPVDPRDMRGYMPAPHHQMQPHATLQPQPGMWQQRAAYDHGMGESPDQRTRGAHGPGGHRPTGSACHSAGCDLPGTGGTREVTRSPDVFVTHVTRVCPSIEQT